MPNPKGQFRIGNSSTPTYGQEHEQAITTLKSGKQVDNQVAGPEETTKTAKEEEESQDNLEGDARPDIAIPIAEDPFRNYVPKALYPKRLMEPKKSSKFDDIMEMFKHVQINIPFLDAIQQVPSYAKFSRGKRMCQRKLS
jgi:hypothetical protein